MYPCPQGTMKKKALAWGLCWGRVSRGHSWFKKWPKMISPKVVLRPLGMLKQITLAQFEAGGELRYPQKIQKGWVVLGAEQGPKGGKTQIPKIVPTSTAMSERLSSPF